LLKDSFYWLFVSSQFFTIRRDSSNFVAIFFKIIYINRLTLRSCRRVVYKYIKNYLAIKSIKANKKLAEFIKKTKKELDIFFGFKAGEPLIFFLDNREDLDLIWGKKTERWFVGAFKNNSIYILNPKVYAQESSHRKEEFWGTFKHEYCHAYYTQITKSHYPVWLNEGLASFISGKKLVLRDNYQDKLVNIFGYFNQADKDVYMVGQFWVEYLLKKYGKKKFLKLIKSFNPGSDYRRFTKNFYHVYGFKFDKKSLAKFVN
jgi:hypothetical protein